MGTPKPRITVQAGRDFDCGRVGSRLPVTAIPHQVYAFDLQYGGIEQSLRLPFLTQLEHRLGMNAPLFSSLLSANRMTQVGPETSVYHIQYSVPSFRIVGA